MSIEKTLYAVIDQVRLADAAMRRISDATHADVGITTAMRTVLERLARAGAQTVPDIARARRVSRQHIQKNVDALAAVGLVELRPNPAHKSSPHVALTQEGRDVFAAIEARERAIVVDLVGRLGNRDLGAAGRTLRALNEALRALDSNAEALAGKTATA